MRLCSANVTLILVYGATCVAPAQIGTEKSIPKHLQDGDEFRMSVADLLKHGENLFRAAWTVQEGGGRPLTKGTGAPLSDLGSPLLFPRNFNRISAPDSNSCFGCHAQPRAGGGGDFVANVFVLGQRFDFATFDAADPIATRGSRDELGQAVTEQSVADERATVGMFGSGFIEMLARQMTRELQGIRDTTASGRFAAFDDQRRLVRRIARRQDGRWDTSANRRPPAVKSCLTERIQTRPSLIVRPFSHSRANCFASRVHDNAMNHHHGIQAPSDSALARILTAMDS